MTARPSGSTARVLVVEDDRSIGAGVLSALLTAGYDASWVQTGEEATSVVETSPPDLVLLDAGLPDVDGFSWCRWLRGVHPELPIVMVTARDAEIDVIVGLDAGATDYVTKPFSTTVLLARIRAHLRSFDRPDPHAPIVVGPLTVDLVAYRATVDGTDVTLRPRELELLGYLARHAGRVLSRERILADVWDLHWDSTTKTVDMHIVALRRALAPQLRIVNVRGVGFRLEIA